MQDMEQAEHNRQARQPQWRMHALGWVIVVGSLAVMFGPSLVGHMSTAADPLVFADDARAQIWPLLRYTGEGLFEHDLIAQYYLDVFPIGFKSLYIWAAWLWHPYGLSKLLPYVLLAITLLLAGAAARRLGGKLATWTTAALMLGCGVYLWRMTGGLPTAFGFPLMAAALWAVVAGQVWALGAVIVLAGLFYPPVAVSAGIALAAWLLLLPRDDRGVAANWPFPRRLTVLVATALLLALAVLPATIGAHRYGRLLSDRDAAQYPEAGPQGRWSADDRPPYPNIVRSIDTFGQRALIGVGEPWPTTAAHWLGATDAPLTRVAVTNTARGAIVIAAVLFCLLAWRDPPARRVAMLFGAIVLGYTLPCGTDLHLFHPQRQVLYGLPILLTVVVASGATSVGRWIAQLTGRPWIDGAAATVLCIGLVAVVGGRGSKDIGLDIRIRPDSALLKFCASVPADSVIAGWPVGFIDDVPYVCQTSVLVSSETHQVFHEQYVLEMRRRMAALIDAYFATEPGPLLRLRDEYDVDYLVIDRRDYGPQPPRYFEPFDHWAEEAHAQMQQAGPETLRHSASAAVFIDGPLLVLDLHRLNP